MYTLLTNGTAVDRPKRPFQNERVKTTVIQHASDNRSPIPNSNMDGTQNASSEGRIEVTVSYASKRRRVGRMGLMIERSNTYVKKNKRNLDGLISCGGVRRWMGIEKTIKIKLISTAVSGLESYLIPS